MGRNLITILCALVFWALLPSQAGAHNPDTSYARVLIGPQQLELRLTYDLFTLNRMTKLDDDGDGAISKAEIERHQQAIHDFLYDHIIIEVNEREMELGELVGFHWPADAGEKIAEADFHAASSLIPFHFVQPVEDLPESVRIEFLFFERLGERHSVIGNFELNGQPEEITFTRFEPDYHYYTGYETPLWKRLLKFLRLGVEHIFYGYDHIAFLLALIVVSQFKELVKVITSFTVAHSLTLVLATLGIVTLPTRLVETAVAATIVYVAVENLWLKPVRRRWILTFCFGLIHGFGFASVLLKMGLPTVGLVRCLISFNVGVELAQLIIVIVLLPLAIGLARWEYGRRVTMGISVVIALFGAAWLVDRAFNLRIMPF